tara:strand:+ start:474 stop:671 length:198 start_codon:yes stop_codon:yes gene_type:complete
MDGYDKPIHIDEFNSRSNGNQIFNDSQLNGESDDDELEISDAMETNEKKLNNLIGYHVKPESTTE